MSRLRKSTEIMNKAFIEKYDMLTPGSHVLCAVSGGKDSMYLLCRMLELAPERKLKISCAHFDHRLRGEESDRDREFVRHFCEERGIACHIGSADVSVYARENSLGIEEAARALRYCFLQETAEKIGANCIATAHTADDNAETVLFNLTRGAGLRGLRGIPPVRGKIIRPMLDISSGEVLDYLNEHGVSHVEDSSNASCDYSRNRLRHLVIPRLREINAGFAENVFRTTESLREDEEYLSSLAEAFLSENYKNFELSAQKLAALPKPVFARALQSIAGGSLSAEHIKAVFAIAAGEKPHACADLPHFRVMRCYDRMIFGAERSGSISPRTLSESEILELPEANLAICTVFVEKCCEIHNSFNTFFFKSDTICGNITVESRKDGEKIRLAGRNCTKTLKKLFSEQRLNGADKELIPVLYDEKGPIAVFGLGMAERCLAKRGDDVIKIEIKPL